MKKISLSILTKLKYQLYYYFKCFKPKNDPNLSDYTDNNNEDYDKDNSDSEIVTLIHLNNK